MEEQELQKLKHAYTLLQESNEKLYNSIKAFQIAAEESGSLVFTYDTKKQMILVDERTAKAFQVEPVQTGVPYDMVERGIISKDTVAEYIRIHEAMIQGQSEARGIVKLIPADGLEIVYELKFRAILNEAGEPTGTAVGIYRDITERYIKDLEQERYQQIVYSSERFTFQYEFELDCFHIFSSHAAEEEMRTPAYTYLQYSELLRTGKICPESDILILQDLFENGAKKPVQVQLYDAKSKEPRWYALTAVVVREQDVKKRVFGTIADITDIKSKELSYQKLERVLKGMKDEYIGIFEVDIETDAYTVLSYTEAGSAEELPENGCYSQIIDNLGKALVAEDYQEAFLKFCSLSHLQQALMKEKRIEFEYMTTTENHTWRRTIYQCVEYQDEKPVKAIMYQLDIDQLKAEKLIQQQMVQDAYAYAESANVAKTEFLSRMSHDIRTPLNAIIGMTAIAGTQIDNQDRVQECLNKITVASKHLLMLINEVLDMSKIESGKLELQEDAFNLADLIDNMITMVLPQMKQYNHELQVNVINLKHEQVIGDSLRLQQAFINLLTNAMKYTPAGGDITINIKERLLENKAYGEYEFTFEDNGIGMTEDFQKVMFDPFTRAEDSRISKVTGTGLGMTITRNLIRMMDGDIHVESQVDQGTKFTVTIHLKLQNHDEELIQELIDLPVLIVDDDAITCESACITLMDIGMLGDWCTSGREAVKKVIERHETGQAYFAVILDWKMPDMDGIATARAIREAVGKDIPIILISAYDWSDIEQKAREAGINGFITKPLFKSRLINSFKEFLNKEQEDLKKMDTVFDSTVDFSGKTVLLVEDNELNAEIVREVLKMSGTQVEWVKNGKEAVEKVLCSEDGYYDMIFMDIQMPVMDGYQATKAIRASGRNDAQTIPIVAMTANAFIEDISRAKKAGMTEYVTKPVDFVQLEQIMREFLL